MPLTFASRRKALKPERPFAAFAKPGHGFPGSQPCSKAGRRTVAGRFTENLQSAIRVFAHSDDQIRQLQRRLGKLVRFDSDHQDSQAAAGDRGSRKLPGRWENMVGLVDYQPVRATGAASQFLNSMNKTLEKSRAFLQWNSHQIYGDVLWGFSKKLHDFRYRWRALVVTKHHGAFDLGIISFGIDDAELVAEFSQPLEKCCCQCRLSRSGWSRNQ